LSRPGSGPIAFGALPFVPDETGSLVVPEVLVARSGDGTAWCTQITSTSATPKASLPDLVAERVPRWSPHDFDLRSCTPHKQWCEILTAAIALIKVGELQKVVLARAIDVTASGPIVIGDVLRRLYALFPSCMVFSIDGFVGASPELLIALKRGVVETHPLAGTVARSGDPDTDARLAAGLLASAKDRWEHQLVIDFIDETMRPLCDELVVPPEPSIVPLRNVSHLGTRIRGVIAASTPHHALDLVALIHPTPAVGGTPTSAALKLISTHEPMPRGRYAGPVGWVDVAGNGEWAVGLRSAQIEGNRARMMAGGGIVAHSDPIEELAETQLKLQALLSAIVRP
jgi:menaquinone-specific isochorismate synthase